MALQQLTTSMTKTRFLLHRSGSQWSRRFSSEASTGAGYGNVRDRVMPSRRNTQLFSYTQQPKTVRIIGAPMTYGQPFVGTDVAPQRLREAGLLQQLTALDWRVHDEADMEFALPTIAQPEWKSAKNSYAVGAGTEKLATVMYETLQRKQFPLILGGDHSIGLGSLAGILRHEPSTSVLWVDAHADLNTPAVSESGNLHGMPIGLIVDGIDEELPPGMEWLQSDEYRSVRLPPSQLVYVGLRDVDGAERDLIQSLGIQAYTMHDIDKYGIGKVMMDALDYLGDKPLHVSYDIDAVDPVLAPATGTTVRGGLTYREAHFVAEMAAQSGLLASAEMVELNPSLSNDAGATETTELGLHICTSMMGKSII